MRLLLCAERTGQTRRHCVYKMNQLKGKEKMDRDIPSISSTSASYILEIYDHVKYIEIKYDICSLQLVGTICHTNYTYL